MATDGELRRPFKIIPFENKGGTLSFRVSGVWKDERIRKNFADRVAAEDFCNRKNHEAAIAHHATVSSIRHLPTRLSDEDLAAAESGVERAAKRWPLSKVIGAGIAALEAADAEVATPLAERHAEWLEIIEIECGERWYEDLSRRSTAFMKAHPGLTTKGFTRAAVRAYLDSLDVAPQTKANTRNVLHRFGAWLLERGDVKENPAAGIWISRKRVAGALDQPKQLPATFTPLQAEAWLRACETAECRRLKGWAVLSTLCGLRPENEAPRLLWSEIKLDAGTLRVLGTKRGQKPRVIKLQPGALAWLKSVKQDGEPTPGFYKRHLRVRAVETANELLAKHHPTEKPIVWEEDIQRHTYASYRLGQGTDVQTVADEMGNSPRVIYGFYRNPPDPAAIPEFWKIFPSE
jgi:site-specific recombinase XerD